MLIGYARVSTDDQNLELQRAALGEAGCTRIYEQLLGANRDRSELVRLLDHLRGGDVVVVHRLDRLARSTRDLLKIAPSSSRACPGRGAASHRADRLQAHQSARHPELRSLAARAESARPPSCGRQKTRRRLKKHGLLCTQPVAIVDRWQHLEIKDFPYVTFGTKVTTRPSCHNRSEVRS
jgi:hypothetical protein